MQRGAEHEPWLDAVRGPRPRRRRQNRGRRRCTPRPAPAPAVNSPALHTAANVTASLNRRPPSELLRTIPSSLTSVRPTKIALTQPCRSPQVNPGPPARRTSPHDGRSLRRTSRAVLRQPPLPRPLPAVCRDCERRQGGRTDDSRALAPAPAPSRTRPLRRLAGRQLMRLAEQAPVATVLRAPAPVVCHGRRLLRLGIAPSRGQPSVAAACTQGCQTARHTGRLTCARPRASRSLPRRLLGSRNDTLVSIPTPRRNGPLSATLRADPLTRLATTTRHLPATLQPRPTR